MNKQNKYQCSYAQRPLSMIKLTIAKELIDFKCFTIKTINKSLLNVSKYSFEMQII